MTLGRRQGGAGARSRLPGAPAVVFLDDWKWHSFHQLAPPLRRAGVRTIRVSTADLRRTHVASQLVFDTYAILPRDAELQGLRQALAGERVVDIQFSEALAGLVRGILPDLEPELAEQLGRRLDFVDKVKAARLFAAGGVRTPPSIPMTKTTPEQAAEELGFPIVVKPVVGCGGAGVTITRDLDELVAAASSGDRGPEDRFYEKYVTGTKLDYAAVVSGHGIEQELVYRISAWQPPAGRATEIEILDDPQLVAFGRTALEVAGCTGMVNMDVIRDEDGVDWLIDFNPRVFGSSGTLRAAGIDTSEGYLRAIAVRTAPPRRTTPVVGTRVKVFPTTLDGLVQEGRAMRTAATFARQSFPYLRWLGGRYWLSEALLTAMAVSSARAERSRERHPAGPVRDRSPEAGRAPVVPPVVQRQRA